MKKTTFLTIAALVLSGSALAVDVAVDPGTGTTGGNPTDTIADALTQVAAGSDAVNTITLADATHVLEADAVWDIPAGKTVNFVAAANRPVIRLTGGTERFNLTIYIPETATLNMDGLAVIPESGQVYDNNENDGIVTWSDTNEDFAVISGTMTFTDVIFGANDGSDGLANVGLHSSYAGNIYGDDIIQFASGGIVTLDNCLFTGAGDDAILFDGDGFDAAGGTPAELNLVNGTAIIHNGGAGIQMYGGETAVNLDGSGDGRIVIAFNGQRSGANDIGFKNFGSAGYSVTMTDTDIVYNTIGGIIDYSYIAEYNLTGCRIAMNNGGDVWDGGNFSYLGSGTDPVILNVDNCTIHDALGVTTTPNNHAAGIVWGDGGATPTWNITDSIFSGVNDTFDLLSGTTGTVNLATSAVVTAGPDAVGNAGDLGTGAVSSDPNYASYTFVAFERGAANPEFLAPTNVADYDTAAGDGGFIGAVDTVLYSPATNWESYQ